MSKHHVRAVFKQFSWLSAYFGKLEDHLTHAIVSCISQETLQLRDGTISEVVCDEYIYTWRMFLFDEKGTLISKLRDGSFLKRAQELLFPKHGTIKPNGKSVREALIKLGPHADECAFVVMLSDNQVLTVFRKNQTVSIRQLLDELSRQDEVEAQSTNEEVRVTSTN